MKNAWRLTLAVLVCGIVAVAQEPKPGTNAPVAQKAEPASKPDVGANYKIGPQDMLRIDVWKEPDISRTIPVRPDGKISLPLLNDVQAAGLTSMELSAVIRDGLTKYIMNPQVTVTVMEINSRRVYCTGEVLKPGALTLLPNMTALQAISSCGGFTQFARIKGIYILRVENGKQVQHPFNYKDVVKGKKPEDNILLQAGDVIVVP
ncbi:MAG TPA: polysaccharide biosynthesis/export family protein [Methylomirabilota bacterium]|nr:polysaccharide biosynthesis/export family protein [Methylomirabilota bacterium]